MGKKRLRWRRKGGERGGREVRERDEKRRGANLV
jgi:hypothetical protein